MRFGSKPFSFEKSQKDLDKKLKKEYEEDKDEENVEVDASYQSNKELIIVKILQNIII